MFSKVLETHISPYPVVPLWTVSGVCRAVCQTQYSVVKYETYILIISNEISRYGTIAKGLTDSLMDSLANCW